MKHFELFLLLFTLLCLCFECKNKFIRNLEDVSSDIVSDIDIDIDSYTGEYFTDSDDTDESSTNSTEIAPKPQFILTGFGNYQNIDKYITFSAFFIRVYTDILPKIVYFTIKVSKTTRLRNLEQEEKSVACNLDEKLYKNDDNLLYNCSFTTTIDNLTSISINRDSIKLATNASHNLTDIDIPLSSVTKQKINNIQEEKGDIKIKDYITLENSTLEQNEMKFVVSGETKSNENLKDGNATLHFYEDNGNLKDIPCELKLKWDNQYDIECTPKIDISGKLDGTEVDTNNKTLIISTKNKDESLYFNVFTNRYFRKVSDKGLSGGAIAAIVISCVVALIFIGVMIVLFNKPKALPPPVIKTSIENYGSDANIADNV